MDFERGRSIIGELFSTVRRPPTELRPFGNLQVLVHSQALQGHGRIHLIDVGCGRT
jgi:hypothetical protein